jgi:hypothetical protein
MSQAAMLVQNSVQEESSVAKGHGAEKKGSRRQAVTNGADSPLNGAPK